mgnify:CR=1 FL=1
MAGLPTTWGVPALQRQRRERERGGRGPPAPARAWCSSARPTCRSTSPTGRASTRSTAPRTTRGTSRARPGGSSGGSAAALAGRAHRPRGRQRHRLVDPQPGALLRRVRPQADVGHRAARAVRPCPGRVAPVGHRRGRPAGAQRRRPRDRRSSVMAGPDEIDGAGWQLRLAPAAAEARCATSRWPLMLDAPGHSRWTARCRIASRRWPISSGDRRSRWTSRARPAIDTRRGVHASTSSSCAPRPRAARPTPTFEQERRASRAARARRRELLRAHDAAAVRMSHRDWLAANEARHRMRLAMGRVLQRLRPAPLSRRRPPRPSRTTSRASATSARSVVNGKRVPVTDHLFWAGYTGVSYLPSTAAPCGFTPGGLPVGVQIVGPQYG